MVNNPLVKKMAQLGLIKAADFEKLINTLNNTTIGTLRADTDTNTANISSLQTAVNTLNTLLTNINNSLTELEGRMQNYENHTHNYQDATINDTSDGSGTESTTTKTTGGVN